MEGKLNNFVVGDVPTLMYVPDFITDDEETQLLNNIYEAPVSKWKSLKNRRLQNWGGVVHEKGLLPQELPSWLKKVTRKIYEESELFSSEINHVLINEYHPNQGIMPHQDGPAYFPVVAILSLGSPAVMDFTPHSRLKVFSNTLKGDVDDKSCDGRDFEIETDEWIDNHHPFSVLLMPRSLLIFKDNVYSGWCIVSYAFPYTLTHWPKFVDVIELVPDYLHGIKDSATQQYVGAVNETEGMTLQKLNEEEADQVMRTGDLKVIHRTKTRISLTCRLVLKVHRNLFKF